MSVHHREDKSARHGRRYAHNLDVVHAHLGLAMLMTERGMLRVAAGVWLASLRQRARASRRTFTEMRAGVSGNAELREEQRHRGQRADSPKPYPFHLNDVDIRAVRIPAFDIGLNVRFPDSLGSRDGRAS